MYIPKEKWSYLWETAVQVDLYDYLINRHPERVRREGSELFLRDNKSIGIKKRTSAAKDFGGKGESWGSIKFLNELFGWNTQETVLELCAFVGVSVSSIPSLPVPRLESERKECPCPPDSGARLYSERYLQSRMIADWMIKKLFDDGIVYQDRWGNTIFATVGREYGELHYKDRSKKKHPYRGNGDQRSYWSLTIGDPQRVYITEAAVDAISLGLLIREPAIYVSVGGVTQYSRIDAAIKDAQSLEVIMAVDNDNPGTDTRQKYKDLKAIIPEGSKDWNELLMKRGEKDGRDYCKSNDGQ